MTEDEGFTCPGCGKIVHDEDELCHECAMDKSERERE
jgi:hypothetical protein